MVQHLFADVINDAIWFKNIHEQNHPWFLVMNATCLAGETTYTNFLICVLIRPEFEPTIYRTRGEHVNHYTSDTVSIHMTNIYIIMLC
jgi:hypothetical protein